MFSRASFLPILNRIDYTYGGQPISSRSDSGGGGADVEKEAFAAAAGPWDRGGGDGGAYHKSVLTARLVPRQSAILC